MSECKDKECPSRLTPFCPEEHPDGAIFPTACIARARELREQQKKDTIRFIQLNDKADQVKI